MFYFTGIDVVVDVDILFCTTGRNYIFLAHK